LKGKKELPESCLHNKKKSSAREGEAELCKRWFVKKITKMVL